MDSKSLPIVVIAYNRPRSLQRLLDSLLKANYPDRQIPLIISIDYSDSNKEVLELARNFNWPYGEKIVEYAKTNLGLRKHVLKCGDYSLQYGNVILLEDDLYVSPCFYDYTQQALAFSMEKSYIGGVSLYNHQFNVHKRVNFSPLEDGYDNWYFQFASSWGQAWTKLQWEGFTTWYGQQGQLEASPEIPENVTSWSDKSWLKYFIAYLIEKDKYFIYPRVSLSTNFSDQGTHAQKDDTSYQVPLLYRTIKNYNFSELQESKSVYDAFYENLGIPGHVGIGMEELCIDLNAYLKTFHKRYILTTQILDFEIIKTFGRSLKPIDANIIFDVVGRDIFLYDSDKSVPNKNKTDKYQEILYDKKLISRNNAKHLYFSLSMNRITDIFKKIFT